MPKLFYDKLPTDIADRWVLLLDPMFATGKLNLFYNAHGHPADFFLPGGSATLAVETLIERGVPEHRILFLNLIASPSGVAEFAERFPKLRVVTSFIDQGLDEKK